ncbi:Wzz/FepE/Etk N-terminal domain-containing protein [Dasania marina]|uniref:Wzz/FepE/Etk N-terminal domain-containing protein n=1 Tax=Dasania marina TaxID=471499 RepID=UPI0014614065|nr:Wzz/FepE/Etk N-terminal domain-containing protein [Dasania marina]
MQAQDEIDLFELMAELWARKALIAAIIVGAICLAVAYLIYTPKVYEAKVYLSEVQPADIAILNVVDSYMSQSSGDAMPISRPSSPVTKESAFALLQKNLNSIAMATAYFKQDIEAIYRAGGSTGSVNELAKNNFLKSLNITKPGKNSDYLTVAYQYTDPAYTAKWLNGYIHYVNNQTKQELLQAARVNKALAIDAYHKQIASLRMVYAQRLQDRIVLLEEAYAIAKKLDFRKPAASSIGNKTLVSKLDESLLYIRGYEVLEAEIEALKSRKEKDPYIPEIRPIQERISYLESIAYDKDVLKVASIDSWAAEPERSVRPSKVLVLMFAVFAGGLLGVLVTLIKWVVENRRNRLLNSSCK